MNPVSAEYLIKESNRIYKENLQSFLKILAPLFLFILVLSVFGSTIRLGFLELIFGISFGIIYAALILIVTITIIIFINEFLESGRKDIKGALSKSISKLLSYVWISILVGVITLVGVLLLIIPGIIFAIWYSLASYAFLIEGKKGGQALNRSKELVRGHFWQVLWAFVLTTLFYALLMLILFFGLSLLIGILSGTPNAVLISPERWWVSLVQDLLGVLFLPFFLSVGILLFRRLREAAPKSAPSPSE